MQSIRPKRSDFFIERIKVELNFKELAQMIRVVSEEKNLPEDSVKEVVEQALAAAYRKDFGDREQEIRVEMKTFCLDVADDESCGAIENFFQATRFHAIQFPVRHAGGFNERFNCLHQTRSIEVEIGIFRLHAKRRFDKDRADVEHPVAEVKNVIA